MDIYEAIFSRRTIRDFDEREVPGDIVKKILNAGLQAPTNNHLREWEFIVLNDKAARLNAIDKVTKNFSKEDVAAILDNWGCTDLEQRDMYFDGIPKQYKMLLTAGCLIIPFFRTYEPLLKTQILSSLNGFASIWCCIENILLAAASEGIYGVTRIPFEEEIKHIKTCLNVPDDYEFPCYIALGYPREAAKTFTPKNNSIESKIHFNNW
ncbi:MAG: nitroreductase [Clostridiaceae bacterium]|nr:nitroreductase [Clostridiaceae bacterium]